MTDAGTSDDVFTIDAYTLNLCDVSAADLTALHALSVSVGWPHRAEDWQFLLELGHGLAARDAGGRVHATAMWFPFGTDFSTIGLVITTPRLQANGGGGWMVRHLLEQTGGRFLGLHATRASYRLFASIGFTDEGTVFQHQGIAAMPPESRAPEGAEVRELRAGDRAALLALDGLATATDRKDLLDALLERSQGVVLYRSGGLAAYALARPFGRGTVVGPVIAATDEDAVAVVRPHLAARTGRFVRLDTGWTGGLFSRFLMLSGLPVFDTVTRMSRGRPWPLAAAPGAAVYGLAMHSTG